MQRTLQAGALLQVQGGLVNMANTRKRPSADFPKTLARLGLVKPDTEFNRRAAAYAKQAEQQAARKRTYQAEKKKL